jgi:hypothetical protein
MPPCIPEGRLVSVRAGAVRGGGAVLEVVVVVVVADFSDAQEQRIAARRGRAKTEISFFIIWIVYAPLAVIWSSAQGCLICLDSGKEHHTALVDLCAPTPWLRECSQRFTARGKVCCAIIFPADQRQAVVH